MVISRSKMVHDGSPRHIWTAMVLFPNQEWATIKCYEGQIREHTPARALDRDGRQNPVMSTS
jgi:hypothetical protein